MLTVLLASIIQESDMGFVITVCLYKCRGKDSDYFVNSASCTSEGLPDLILRGTHRRMGSPRLDRGIDGCGIPIDFIIGPIMLCGSESTPYLCGRIYHR